MSSNSDKIGNLFNMMGARFVLNPNEINERLIKIKAFVFDWDGVFNNATKTGETGSPFAEPDAMGTNMLRFSYWLIHGRLPVVYILSGENNPPAMTLVKRENFHGAYLNFKDKLEALEMITAKHDIDPKEIAFVFDDILDIPVAAKCGLPLQVKRTGSPVMDDYIDQRSIAAYVTANEGGRFAVREICELLMGLHGNFEETIENRLQLSEQYLAYFKTRKNLEPEIVIAENNRLKF